MREWFTIEHIDEKTHIISEYRHWEESHSYLLCGEDHSLLIDTGLGIQNIHEQVAKLTDKPVVAVATHVHWDHIGGHKYFPDFYAHEAELDWLQGGFPLTMEQIREFVVERCDLPDGFNVQNYRFFQGTPTRVLRDNDVIDIGGRRIQVLHTPGHSPGHMCFYEEDKGYLFTGDLIYIGTLFAHFPSTDPAAYLLSVDRLTDLTVNRVLPAHHDWKLPVSIITETHDAFHRLHSLGRLHHGSGVFDFGCLSIWL